ncbi:pyrimidine/purine nucleoside phosphorylase [Psychromonas sp. RZ22]|uniref:pyrimidine/purine nucleoside phosphorylase n=1 Tax=Psychromonas algarum TaxID=2555643 RepID=UPI00106899F2|nr:pyrimidine/purine nucleoside phosphorylase [Psychromonas sp. RZ22]TEW53525.1 pyrimidine/purine nucleoside phosphorylase [Psychromonas sp. RZ22]
MSFETNEYFDGNVTSIAFQSETLPATVGVMEVGEYTFDAGAKEYMTVVSGNLTIQFPGYPEWTTFNAGETFEVPANTSFNVKVTVQTAYLCLYEK